jgi:ribosome-binding factor A
MRGRLGRLIDMRFTPDLRFIHDDTFDTANYMDRLLADPRVRADVEKPDEEPFDNEPGA